MAEQHHQREREASPAKMIGTASSMAPVYELIERVCDSDATVLITGESGVGKELVARSIHQRSPRAERPLITVNCAALPQSVLESELFGHELGAFTGAVKQRAGRFELAHTGTLFLDEIGDLPQTTQIMLLRVLQERQFERVGGSETLDVDVRVVVATNRDLLALVREGRFREDLYYRLAVVPIHVPPLRERRADIPRLADFFVERYGQGAKPIRRIATSAIDLLCAYHWPGNVRELENCIERAVLFSDDGVIHAHDLPPTLQMPESSAASHRGGLTATLDRVERDMIVDALKASRGNMAEAARLLEVSERLIGLRVRKHGIDRKRFK
jgi:Nif-specific regulatory protein